MGQDAGVGWEVVSTPFAADLEATTHTTAATTATAEVAGTAEAAAAAERVASRE